MRTQIFAPQGPPRGEVEITSYGILHGEPPAGHGYTVDVSRDLRNPHEHPAMRYKTGLDREVYDHVMDTPGALELSLTTTARLHALVELHDGQPVRALVYCRGGRHRSAAIAQAVASELCRAGITVHLTHRDVDEPVVQPV